MRYIPYSTSRGVLTITYYGWKINLSTEIGLTMENNLATEKDLAIGISGSTVAQNLESYPLPQLPILNFLITIWIFLIII